MNTGGWRGKNRSNSVPLWKLQARKAQTIASTKGYSMGGLPRRNRQRQSGVSLPKLRCLEKS